MAKRIMNRSDGSPLWWIDLDHDATVAIYSYWKFKTKAYGLMHENGSLMFDSNGAITASDWATICRLAQMNSTNWIVLYHEWRIVRVVFTAHGAYVEGGTVMQPCRAAIPTLNSRPIPEDAEEKDHDAFNEEPPAQPALKGTQRRASKNPRPRKRTDSGR